MTTVWKPGLALILVLSLAACGRGAPEPESDVPTLDLTSWTDETELFMEYPPLVAGRTALFAVHLTRLSDFSAMTAGRPRLELTPESGGTPLALQGEEPSRPGVFRIEAAAPPAGRYRWALAVDAPGLADRHELGVITVFTEEGAALADAERHAADDPAVITYLKEPQWTIGFATVSVRDAEVRRSLRVSAVVEPLPGGDAIVAAPASGRFMAGALPEIGATVRSGQELGRIQPRLMEDGADRATLVSAMTEAQASADAARADLARAERLLAERAVPARRVEEARRVATIAEARLTAAEARLAQRDETLRTGGGAISGNSFVLRAPIAGRVAEQFAAIGTAYDAGAPLFRIVRTDRVGLLAHVPASDAPLIKDVVDIALEVPGRPDPIAVKADQMRDAGVIDPRTRALPVQFEIDNRTGQLLLGQTATAILYMGARQRMPAVPKDAVLTEAGRPYVFVQTGGESFARRFIEVAAREGNLVGVLSGVTRGERVVTRGAYDVQLASAAGGLPAEGHVH